MSATILTDKDKLEITRKALRMIRDYTNVEPGKKLPALRVFSFAHGALERTK